MNGCPIHGPLVGGYVLGALEPDEMDVMRRHVASCPHCGAEARRLAGVPGLLDRIEPADVPPPSLSPQVEEAVLDRFARERRAQAERHRPRIRLPRRPLALAGAAAAVALALALVLLLPLGGDEGRPAYASVSLDRVAASRGAAASAELAAVPAGTGIRLETRGLRANEEYEVWCIQVDGRWVSGGTFRSDRDGRARAYLTAAVRPGDYHVMVVTRRPEVGGGTERGPTVLRGKLRY